MFCSPGETRGCVRAGTLIYEMICFFLQPIAATFGEEESDSEDYVEGIQIIDIHVYPPVVKASVDAERLCFHCYS
jgi:hypothetical protein